MNITKHSDTQNISKIGKDFVTLELVKRGSQVAWVSGRKNLVKAVSSITNREVTIRVKTRASGNWQIPITEEQSGSEPENETKFWILVDLTVSKTQPTYYIMPDWWIRNDIYHQHRKYLFLHGGERPVNNDSTHHSVAVDRVVAWEARWDILKLF